MLFTRASASGIKVNILPHEVPHDGLVSAPFVPECTSVDVGAFRVDGTLHDSSHYGPGTAFRRLDQWYGEGRYRRGGSAGHRGPDQHGDDRHSDSRHQR